LVRGIKQIRISTEYLTQVVNESCVPPRTKSGVRRVPVFIIMNHREFPAEMRKDVGRTPGKA
jgi:hypothetical protein